EGLRVFPLNPRCVLAFRKHELRGGSIVAIHQSDCGERCITSRNFWDCTPSGGFTRRQTIGQYDCIGVEGRVRGRFGVRGSWNSWSAAHHRAGRQVHDRNALERTVDSRRFRQFAVKLSGTADRRLAPDYLFHRSLWLDPGPRRLTPTARGCHGHLQAKAIRFGSCVTKCVLPFWRHPNEWFVEVLGYTKVSIEHLHSANADAVHPLKIGGDPLFAHVTAHPMP